MSFERGPVQMIRGLNGPRFLHHYRGTCQRAADRRRCWALMTGMAPGGRPAPMDIVVDAKTASLCARYRRQFAARSAVLDAIVAALYGLTDTDYALVVGRM